jgi:hypothetical protein
MACAIGKRALAEGRVMDIPQLKGLSKS